MELTQRQLFLQHVAQTSDAPMALEIEKANGCWLFGKNGERYLDLIAGISVSNLGHNNEGIKNAIKNQLDHYMHLMVYGEYIQLPQVQLAQFLAQQLPQQLQSVYYTNSGAEATEGALKLAKRVTGRTEIVSFNNSYHGSTHGALSVGGDEERKQAFRPLLPDMRLLNFNDFDQINAISNKTACVIMEIVQAEAGVILPLPNYLQAIRKKCDATGALLIFDECQTGCGRSGELFAFQKMGVVPDVLNVAKAFGGGMPLAAFISSLQNMNTFTNNPVLGHLTTFGGHPVCCAAALASLQQIVDSSLLKHIETKALLFKKLLVNKHIKDVRCCGLLIALEFESAQFTISLCSQLIKKGIVSDWFLFAAHCLRIAPPLIISIDEIEFACAIINETIDELKQK